MIFKKSNINDKYNQKELDDNSNYEIIENNINNISNDISNEDNDIVGDYIYNNNQIIINNNLNDFIKDKSFKNIQNDESKIDIFNFASFINSCKLYTNISQLLIDFKKVLKTNKKIENNDYYFNIINNYFNNILDIITKKDFFKKEKNIDDLLETFKKIEKYMKINDNQYYMIKKEIVSVERKICEILNKNRNNKGIKECINIINNNIKYLEKNTNKKNKINSKNENITNDNTIITINNSNINNNYNNINDSNKELILNNGKDLEDDKIVIHFNTYKKSKNISNWDNEVQNNNDIDNGEDDYSNLNKAQNIKDNSIDDKINNFGDINDINNIGKKKKKKPKKKKKNENNKAKEQEEKEISYDYENLMCPPIKNDDSD